MNLNSTVIKANSYEHAKLIIQWWKAQGADTNGFNGSAWDMFPYYGLREDAHFNVYTEEMVISRGYTVIELPTANGLPKRGDKILVWDNDMQLPMERLFVAYVEGASYPVMCVSGADEAEFLANQPFSITEWRQYRPIEPVLELTIEEIAKRYGVATVKIVESNLTK